MFIIYSQQNLHLEAEMNMVFSYFLGKEISQKSLHHLCSIAPRLLLVQRIESWAWKS